LLFHKNRKRRVIFNDDADQQFVRKAGPPLNVRDEESFINARTTPTFDTHVDTYVWCVGNGADPPWGRWAETLDYEIQPFLGDIDQAADSIIDACHANGMEVWASFRINDLHDASAQSIEDTNDPLKARHPEYLLGTIEDRSLGTEFVESHSWSAFNFERAEVRQHRLEYIKNDAAAHDFDGYELDFTRFIWNFPQGRERVLAPLMTDFLRDFRSELDFIGRRRGRPYTLVTHVPDSLETSLNLGLDVETWVSDGLVDVLVVGMGFMPNALRLGQWKELSERYNTPIYPSLNTRPLFRMYKDRFKRDASLEEYIRGAAARWWQDGSDGIYLFNLFTHYEHKGFGPLDKKFVYPALADIGEPAALIGKDKIYGIEGPGGMFNQASEAAVLPVPLDIHERRLPLNIGPDAEDPRARFQIHVWTSHEAVDVKVWIRLNHVLLQTVWQNGCYTVEVPDGILLVGRNELSVFCNVELTTSDTAIIVHEILVSVKY